MIYITNSIMPVNSSAQPRPAEADDLVSFAGTHAALQACCRLQSPLNELASFDDRKELWTCC